jgi:tetratricopeptide (TPR) repeat protein
MTFRCRAHRSVLLFALFMCALVWGGSAQATPKAFGQADAAWHQGELDKAKDLYEAAVKEGGLEPNEVVIAYSRIGTVRAALKDSNGALSAFRIAAAIDPEFELPADSGPIAKKLYTQARKETAEQGGEKLNLKLKLPDSIPQKEGFSVETEIPAGFAVLVAEVSVTIEDPVTGKRWRRKKPAEPTVTFDFPSRVAIPGARLKIKAAAVDSQNNAWAVADGKLKVEGSRPSAAAAADDGTSDEQMPGPKKDPKKDDSIFDGPIPWIVGGAVLLGGIIIYAVASSSSEVNVGAPSWRANTTNN